MTAVSTTCPSCGLTARVPETALGKSVRCPRCSARFAVSESHEPAAAPPAPTVAEGAELPAPVSRDFALTTEKPQQRGAAEWRVGDVVLDLYEVTAILGQGGMGRVYRVRHRGWGVDLAVKAPLPAVLKTMGADNFEREAETWVNLGLHPHVVSCYYVRRVDGAPRVFTELVDGGSLHDWIRTGRLRQLDLMLDVAIQFAWGLHYAHEQGLVHQDVKPANALLSRDGIVKVTDFGLARAKAVPVTVGVAASGETMSVAGGGGGTPAYMAPEQSGGGTLTRRTDLWGWALTVLELFVGGRSWEFGIAASELLESFVAQGARVGELPQMPAGVVDLLRGCFREDASERPRSLWDAAAALYAVYEEVSGHPYPRPEPTAGRDTADSLSNRAVSLLDLGRTAEAERLWQRALATTPQHLEATYNLGLHLWGRGQVNDDELVNRMSAAAKSHQGEARAALLQGKLLLGVGEYDLALRQIEAGRAKEAGTVDADRDWALALCAQARDSEDTETWQRVGGAFDAILQSGHAEPPDIAGYALSLARLGQPDQAAAWLSQTAARHPNLAASVSAAAGQWLPGFELALTTKGLQAHAEAAAFTPDGRRVLIGAAERIVTWDVESGVLTECHREREARVRALLVTPDGGSYLRAADGAPLQEHVLATGHVARTLPPQPGFITALAQSRDGRWVVSGGTDRVVRLWDLKAARCVQAHSGHSEAVLAVAIAPDAHLAVSGGQDGTVRVWDLVNGKALAQLNDHRGRVSAVALDVARGLVASAGEDALVRLWDLKSGQVTLRLAGHTRPISALALCSPRGLVISAGADRALRVHDLGDGHLLSLTRLDAPVSALACTADVVVAAHGLRLSCVRLPERQHLPPLAIARPVSASEVTQRETQFETHVESARVALGQGQLEQALEQARKARSIPGFERAEAALVVWDRLGLLLPRRGVLGAWETNQLEGHGEGVLAVAVDATGAQIASGGMDSTLRLWDLGTRQCLSVLRGHGESVTAVRFTPDGKSLVSGGWDRTARLWDIASGRELRRFEEHDEYVSAVAVTPDGTLLLTACWDQELRLWDAGRGELLAVLSGHTANVGCVEVGPDGRFAVSGGWDGAVRVWDIEERSCVLLLEGHEGTVNAVAVSPTGRQLVSGGQDRSLRLWDVRGRRSLRTLLGHDAEVTAVAFTPDGRFVVSASRDKSLCVWDLSQGRCVRRIESTAAVMALAVVPTGCDVVTGGTDRAVRLWHLDWEPEARALPAWDEKARPFLETFVSLRLKTQSVAPARGSRPAWNENDVSSLVDELHRRGFGGLSRESVLGKLDDLTRRGEAMRSFWDEVRTVAPAIKPKPVREARRIPSGKLLLGALIVVPILIIAWQLFGPAPRPRLVPHLVKAAMTERSLVDVSLYSNDCSLGDQTHYLELAIGPDASAPELFCAARATDAATVDAFFTGMVLEDDDAARAHQRYRNAVSLVAGMGERGASVVCPYLKDPRPGVQRVTRMGLVWMDKPAARECLLGALESADPRMRSGAVTVLRHLLASKQLEVSAGWTRLQRLLKDGDALVRARATESAVIFGPERSGPLVRQLLADPDTNVRHAAQEALKRIEDAVVYERLYGRDG
jgi:WD40 repeat protein/serine/threonine protein kinase